MPVVQLRPATIEEELSRNVSTLLSETYRYRERHLNSLDAGSTRSDVHLSNEAQIRDVVSIMDANGDSDEDLGSAMDIAGEILRERKLVSTGNDDHQLRPVVEPVDGGHPYFGMHILVDVSVGEAFEMTCDYADRLAASALKIPMSLVLSFKSTACGPMRKTASVM